MSLLRGRSFNAKARAIGMNMRHKATTTQKTTRILQKYHKLNIMFNCGMNGRAESYCLLSALMSMTTMANMLKPPPVSHTHKEEVLKAGLHTCTINMRFPAAIYQMFASHISVNGKKFMRLLNALIYYYVLFSRSVCFQTQSTDVRNLFELCNNGPGVEFICQCNGWKDIQLSICP